jgi:hypothetical protein
MTLSELLAVMWPELGPDSDPEQRHGEAELRAAGVLGPTQSLAAAAFAQPDLELADDVVERVLRHSRSRYRARGGYLERVGGGGVRAVEAYRRWGETIIRVAWAYDGAPQPIPGQDAARRLDRVLRHKLVRPLLYIVPVFFLWAVMLPQPSRQCVNNARIRRRERQARARGLAPATTSGYVPYPFLVVFWPLLGFGLVLVAGWVTDLPPGPWWVRLPVLVAVGDGVALLAWLTFVPIAVMNQVGLANARQSRVAAERANYAADASRPDHQ